MIVAVFFLAAADSEAEASGETAVCVTMRVERPGSVDEAALARLRLGVGVLDVAAAGGVLEEVAEVWGVLVLATVEVLIRDDVLLVEAPVDVLPNKLVKLSSRPPLEVLAADEVASLVAASVALVAVVDAAALVAREELAVDAAAELPAPVDAADPVGSGC